MPGDASGRRTKSAVRQGAANECTLQAILLPGAQRAAGALRVAADSILRQRNAALTVGLQCLTNICRQKAVEFNLHQQKSRAIAGQTPQTAAEQVPVPHAGAEVFVKGDADVTCFTDECLPPVFHNHRRRQQPRPRRRTQRTPQARRIRLGKHAGQERVILLPGQALALLTAERAEFGLALELDTSVVPIIDAQTEFFTPKQAGSLIRISGRIYVVKIQTAHFVAAAGSVRVGAAAVRKAARAAPDRRRGR